MSEPSEDEKLILLIKETRDRADWFRLEQSKAAPRPYHYTVGDEKMDRDLAEALKRAHRRNAQHVAAYNELAQAFQKLQDESVADLLALSDDKITALHVIQYKTAAEAVEATHKLDLIARDAIAENYKRERDSVLRACAEIFGGLDEICPACKNQSPERKLGSLDGYIAGLRQIIDMRERACADERERCAKVCEEWLRVSELLLHCGEMSAQEIRTVKAVLTNRAAAIRALPLPALAGKQETAIYTANKDHPQRRLDDAPQLIGAPDRKDTRDEAIAATGEYPAIDWTAPPTDELRRAWEFYKANYRGGDELSLPKGASAAPESEGR